MPGSEREFSRETAGGQAGGGTLPVNPTIEGTHKDPVAAMPSRKRLIMLTTAVEYAIMIPTAAPGLPSDPCRPRTSATRNIRPSRVDIWNCIFSRRDAPAGRRSLAKATTPVGKLRMANATKRHGIGNAAS